jgi:short-subunit dehydrogenase
VSQAFAERYGPWAIVTGASSGIGEAIALALARRGVQSLLVARRADRLTQVAEEVRRRGGTAETLPLDLAEMESVAALAEQCRGRDIGLIVANAGINPEGEFAELSPETHAAIVAVNVRAPVLLARTFLPLLARRGRGGFLITGSIEGFVGFPHSATYSASKGFVHAFTQALWVEYRGHGVDVLGLAPGATDTPLLRRNGFEPGELPGVLSAERVAEFALDRLRKGPLAVPGWTNRLFVAALKRTPRRLLLPVLGKAMQAAHRKARAKLDAAAARRREET